MMQVCKQHGVLFELVTRLLIFNKTLISTMKALSHVRYILSILTDVCTSVPQLTLGIFSLKEGIDSFCGYMCVLACHEVKSLIVPSSNLRIFLLHVRKEICTHPN